MGIVPIWGFQLIAAISLAFVLRLNKALVILAVNISIPPMIPLILFLSHETGAIWMGNDAVSLPFNSAFTSDFLKYSFLQYVIGAVTLAVFSGGFFGLITFGLLKVFRKG